jgi:hypothetical protein
VSSLKVSTVLRAIGAATFVVAGASFLVEGWTDPGILRRQLLWAAGTLLMTLCGILAARRFRDAVGARVFLGLAAATIPAHFAQVGSSVWALYGEKTGTLTEVLAAGGILLALAPPLALGVSALVRRRARLLVGLIFLTGLPLLLPTRNGDAVAFMSALELLLCLGLEATVFRHDKLFETVEGVAARVLVFLPCVVMLVRNALYVETRAWGAALIAAPALSALVLPRVWSRTGHLARAFQIAGGLGLCLAAGVAIQNHTALCVALSVVTLLASELVTGEPEVFAWGATGFLAAAGALSVLEPGIGYLLAAVPFGLLHAFAAFRRRAPARTACAAAITVISVVARLATLIRFPVHHVWVPAVAISLAFLIAASALERHRDGLHRILSRLEGHFAPKA